VEDPMYLGVRFFVEADREALRRERCATKMQLSWGQETGSTQQKRGSWVGSAGNDLSGKRPKGDFHYDGNGSIIPRQWDLYLGHDPQLKVALVEDMDVYRLGPVSVAYPTLPRGKKTHVPLHQGTWAQATWCSVYAVGCRPARCRSPAAPPGQRDHAESNKVREREREREIAWRTRYPSSFFS
jgi:hypothetical protein